MVKTRMSKRRQPCLLPVLVLVLALGVQGTAGQLWDKVPFISRFTKAAQAAKAAAASLTAPHAPTATPSLPPAAPVLPPSAAAPADPQGAKAPAGQQAQKGKNGGKKGNNAPKLKTTGKNDTQAGCSCLAEWDAKPGGAKLSGCANPDNDPLGAWCPVDPNECLGYYSMYRTEKGKLRFYDYCVPVRERTKKGCLCSSDWNLGDGAVGKPHYRDGCARPQAAQGPRVCKVDAATCPAGVEVNEFDECADKAETMLLPQAKTWHNCNCIQGWNYKYEDGTTAIFSTCANPDGDPLGAWCEVDPNVCSNSVTITKNGNQKMSIDYCQSRFNAPEVSTCTAQLKLHDQCGGKSNCTHSSCLNAPWPGACCPQGSECRRQDAFFYQCVPMDADATTKTYQPAPAATPADSPSMPKDTIIVTTKSPGDSTGSSGSGSGSGSSSSADSSNSEAKDASSASDTEGAPGQLEPVSHTEDADDKAGERLWVKARLGLDYDLLVSQPHRLAQFKSDVTGWLRTVVGDTKHIYGVGVEEILPGSVIALSYLDFDMDAPQESINAATENLQANAQSQYADSKLPAKWGWLLNYSMGKNKTELLEETMPSSVEINTVAFPTGMARPAAREPMQLSHAAKITIIVVCVALLLTAVCIIVMVKRKRAEKRHEARKRAAAAAAARRKAVVSGYLHDIDGMDESGTESCQTTTAKSTEQAASTLHKVGQGLRGALSTNRNTLTLGSGNIINGGAKRPSETGSSRLWNWLQKAETPTSVDARNAALHTDTLITGDSVLKTGAGESKEGTLPSVLPSPRPISSHPLPALDGSDPGGAFRVPPPSPRFTDRASGPNESPAEAAAAAVAAATAATAGASAGTRNTAMLSPHPAPAQAALMSSPLSREGVKHGSVSSIDERRAVGPMTLMTSPASGLRGGIQGLDTYQSGMTLYGTASDFSIITPQGSGGVGHTARSAANALMTSAGDELVTSGRLPPGMGMGPFLRAAIKSLTGQSVEGSPEQSEAGSPDGPNRASGYGGPLFQPSSGLSKSTQSVPLQGFASQGSASCEPGATRPKSQQPLAAGSGVLSAHLSEESPREELNTVGSTDTDMQGSVFQSLWMHRLLAAAQAQQGDESMGYGG